MKVSFNKPNRSFGFFDALGLAGLLGFAIARFIPVARLPFWGCVLRQTTGWPCPGCGLTRVADRFAHGNFAGAWDANPLGTIAAACFAVLAVWTALHLSLGVPTPDVSTSPREERFIRVGVVAAVLINYGVVILRVKFPGVLA